MFPLSSFSQSMWRTRPKLSFPKGCTSQIICHSICYTHTKSFFFHPYVPSTIFFVTFSTYRPNLLFFPYASSTIIFVTFSTSHTNHFFHQYAPSTINLPYLHQKPFTPNNTSLIYRHQPFFHHFSSYKKKNKKEIKLQ